MTIDEQIGANLRHLRERAKMSQTALGQVLGVTFQQVQKYEGGRNRLSLASALKIAGALGISIQALSAGAAQGSQTYDAGYQDGSRDGRAEGITEGISRALARLRPTITELEKSAYEIKPDDTVVPIRTHR
jgi:transcriptional regulator with XRE-family HTH domain